MATKAKAVSNGMTDMRKVLSQYSYGTATTMDIPVAKLIGEDFQRETNVDGARHMAANYDRNQFQLPTVAPLGDGTYSVIDGLHRVEMARSLNIDTITCQVADVRTYEQRAELFTNLNRNRRWLTPTDTYKSELAAKKPWAIEVNKILAARGLEIRSKRSPNGISSAMAVKSLYKAGGAVRLAVVLDIVLAAWPETDPRRFAGEVLRGIDSFIASNPKADHDRIARSLANITGQRLCALGTQRWYAWQALDGRGGSRIEAIADEIKKLYGKTRA